jgi:hypothetical protein
MVSLHNLGFEKIEITEGVSKKDKKGEDGEKSNKEEIQTSFDKSPNWKRK